jgi:hypothetical protein
VRWTAPEALEDRRYSVMSDCWSFGIILYEIWTDAAIPYEDMSNEKVWVSVVNGYRLAKPTTCPDELYAIMTECWHQDPAMRPNMSTLQVKFRQAERHNGLFSLPQTNQGDSTPTQSIPIEHHHYVEFMSSDDTIPALINTEQLAKFRKKQESRLRLSSFPHLAARFRRGYLKSSQGSFEESRSFSLPHQALSRSFDDPRSSLSLPKHVAHDNWTHSDSLSALSISHGHRSEPRLLNLLKAAQDAQQTTPAYITHLPTDSPAIPPASINLESTSSVQITNLTDECDFVTSVDV